MSMEAADRFVGGGVPCGPSYVPPPGPSPLGSCQEVTVRNECVCVTLTPSAATALLALAAEASQALEGIHGQEGGGRHRQQEAGVLEQHVRQRQGAEVEGLRRGGGNVAGGTGRAKLRENGTAAVANGATAAAAEVWGGGGAANGGGNVLREVLEDAFRRWAGVTGCGCVLRCPIT